MHRHTAPGQLVGSLDGPSRTITVEPLQVPATQPAQPAVAPEPEPEPAHPATPEREPARA